MKRIRILSRADKRRIAIELMLELEREAPEILKAIQAKSK